MTEQEVSEVVESMYAQIAVRVGWLTTWERWLVVGLLQDRLRKWAIPDRVAIEEEGLRGYCVRSNTAQ